MSDEVTFSEAKELAERITTMMPDEPNSQHVRLKVTAALGMVLTAMFRGAFRPEEKEEACDFFCETLKKAVSVN
jgi:hypothetical protein